MKYVVAIAIQLAAASWSLGAAPPADFQHAVEPFLQQYCLRCHGPEKHDGEFRLDTLSRDFFEQLSAQKWAEVMTRINAGEMPPKDAKQPATEEVGRISAWFSARLKEGEAARMARRGPVAHYRLSRDEYAATVYDLIGVHYDVHAPGAFNEDPRWHGFERIGSMLSLSPSHVDHYFKAAETVLKQAFLDRPVASTKQSFDANKGREAWLAENKIEGRVRSCLWPGRSIGMNVPVSGTYRVRIQLSGMQPPGGNAPHLALWSSKVNRSFFDQDVITTEDQPTTLEFETYLPQGGLSWTNSVNGPTNEGHTISGNARSIFISTKETRFLTPWGRKLTDDSGQAIHPLLLIDWYEVEGPLSTESDRLKREGLLPSAKGDLAESRASLQRFAERAWRRPVSDAEIDRYAKVVENELAAGEKLPTAHLAAMVAVLTSKNFYYLEEGSAKERREKVSDWELASRLSYFLWGSMPDEELFAAARSGVLTSRDMLKAQFARMLADPKITRFTDAFPRQWLQLYKVGMFQPDAALYPDYDKWLERSMVLETTSYFNEMFSQNLPLGDMLASDWTMMNPRLALHYGLPQPTGAGFQKVKLRPEDHRGGLLTQSSILSLTSDGTRHRPVHRGVWVSEAIFGKTPPPPPPNVEPLEPTPVNAPKATIRMQLDAHATHSVCASCHRNIDPLGFAFDNYDAIGRWRTEERVSAGKGADPPVNATGKLADGRTFNGPDEFKQLLVADIDRVAEAFVESLATFALRRVMTIDDTDKIRAIAQASKADDYRLRSLIENFVLSDLFQQR